MPATTDFFDTEHRNWRDRLAVSVDLVRELSRSSDPHAMYQLFVRRMGELLPVSRRLSITRRGLSRPDYRVTRFSQWKEPSQVRADRDIVPVHSGGLLAELLYGDEPRVIDDLVLDADDPASNYLAGQRSLLAIPHFEHGNTVSMLVLGREETAAFPRDRIPDLVLMSNLFSRAIQTLLLSKAVRDAYDTVDYELRTVAEIQRSLLPTGTPCVAGLDVAVHYQTAARAGGDYYDFFELPGGRLGVLIADASGHGAPAAVLMAMTHSMTHARPNPPVSPGELLTTLNTALARRYTRPTGSFVTAFYAVFDPIEHKVSYASAGHTPPRLVRAVDGSRIALNRAQRLPLGIKPDEVYTEQTLTLFPRDQVVFFTDGVIEAVNLDGDVFGVDRIDEAMSAPLASAPELLASILGRLSVFTIGAAQTDDRTLVVVRRSHVEHDNEYHQ